MKLRRRARHAAVLLSVIGASNYLLLRNLISPASPKDKSFADLMAVLKGHFAPKPLTIAERFKFHRRYQKEGETVTEYVAELGCLSKHCEFGTALNETLCDRFVCGLKYEAIQKCLIGESNNSFKDVVDLAQTMESAEKTSKDLKSKEMTGVSKFQQEKRETCCHCGRMNHEAFDCRFQKATCYNYDHKGHIAPVCKFRRPPSHKTLCQFQTRRKVKKVDMTEDQLPSPEERADLPVHKLDSKGEKPIHVKVSVQG